MGRPPLSRLRRRFAPLRGTQRRCAALRAAPPGRYAPRALRAQAFCKHEKNAEYSTVSQKTLDHTPLHLFFPSDAFKASTRARVLALNASDGKNKCKGVWSKVF